MNLTILQLLSMRFSRFRVVVLGVRNLGDVLVFGEQIVQNSQRGLEVAVHNICSKPQTDEPIKIPCTPYLLLYFNLPMKLYKEEYVWCI